MPRSELVETLRMDLADPEKDLFSDEVLERCILKSVYPLSNDLGIELSIRRGNVSPKPEGHTKELLLLLSQIHACQYMRAATASSFSFTSGDKRVDKTRQPEHWAKLEEDLKVTYRQRLGEIKPETVLGKEDYIIYPAGINPLIYEQGKNL